MGKLNRAIFYPAVFLLGISAIVSIVWKDSMVEMVRSWNVVILEKLTPLYAYLVLAFIVAVFVIYISPVSKLKIGGAAAQPLLRPIEWFAVTLCTTIATGLLFWASAEPLFHVYLPPSSHITPESKPSQIFALSSLLMHWTLSPYAIYTCIALLAAIALHNRQLPFRPSSLIVLAWGKPLSPVLSNLADISSLFAMIGGMTASLGAGILTLSGGLSYYLGWKVGFSTYAFLTFGIVLCFVFSSISGLQKGIKSLSMVNLFGFLFFLLLFSFIPNWHQLFDDASKAVAQYIYSFIPRSINYRQVLDVKWFQQWTIFNWANWLAWAPVTALFLGFIAKGYTIRQFILVNLLLPAVFGMLWVLLVGGSAIQMDQKLDSFLYTSIGTQGPESVQFQILSQLPGAQFFGILFLVIIAISYVTAADSSTEAISRLCYQHDLNSDHPISKPVKILWGVIIGILAVTLIGSTGIEGIKMISVLGGVPALFFCLVAFFGLFRLK